MKTIGLTARQRANGGRYAGTAERWQQRAAAQRWQKVPQQIARDCGRIGVDARSLLCFCDNLCGLLHDGTGRLHSSFDVELNSLGLARIFIKQRGRCALTGQRLSLALREPAAATPLRWTKELPWEPGNILFAQRIVVERMADIQVRDFIKLCQAVARHTDGRDRDAELLAAIEAA